MKRKALAKALEARRLPSYRLMLEELGELSRAIDAVQLWEHLFHCPAPLNNGIFNFQCELAWRVDKELFPVALHVMDEILYCGEDPFDYPIQPAAYGVPWEFMETEDLEPECQPLVTVLANCGEIESDVLCGEEPGLRWPENGVERLAALPAPLDGLATLYHCVVKDTGNVFLTCSLYGEDDYMWGPEYWCVEGVEVLRREYEAVRADVERLAAYKEWFDKTPGAAGRVEQELLALCELTEECDDGTDDGA
ncbi:MAG: hypothetical protein JXA14_26200 [Anaerolineae bacterium]|nr:hypothetical protein [Anaerolineae bacterium]